MLCSCSSTELSSFLDIPAPAPYYPTTTYSLMANLPNQATPVCPPCPSLQPSLRYDSTQLPEHQWSDIYEYNGNKRGPLTTGQSIPTDDKEKSLREHRRIYFVPTLRVTSGKVDCSVKPLCPDRPQSMASRLVTFVRCSSWLLLEPQRAVYMTE